MAPMAMCLLARDRLANDNPAARAASSADKVMPQASPSEHMALQQRWMRHCKLRSRRLWTSSEPCQVYLACNRPTCRQACINFHMLGQPKSLPDLKMHEHPGMPGALPSEHMSRTNHALCQILDIVRITQKASFPESDGIRFV